MAIALNTIGDRIAKIDSAVQWKSYTSLAALSIVAGHKRSVLETRVFGNEKPSAEFRRCYSRAKQLVGHAGNVGLGKERQAELRRVGIDDALAAMLTVLENHMVALGGVTSAAKYDAVREYATIDDIPAAAPEGEGATSEQQPAPSQGKPMEMAVAAMMALSAAELCEFASKVQARLIDLQEAEQLPMAA